MAYYSVLDVTPTNTDWVPDYVGTVTALVAQHARTAGSVSHHFRIEGKHGLN